MPNNWLLIIYLMNLILFFIMVMIYLTQFLLKKELNKNILKFKW